MRAQAKPWVSLPALSPSFTVKHGRFGGCSSGALSARSRATPDDSCSLSLVPQVRPLPPAMARTGQSFHRGISKEEQQVRAALDSAAEELGLPSPSSPSSPCMRSPTSRPESLLTFLPDLSPKAAGFGGSAACAVGHVAIRAGVTIAAAAMPMPWASRGLDLSTWGESEEEDVVLQLSPLQRLLPTEFRHRHRAALVEKPAKARLPSMVSDLADETSCCLASGSGRLDDGPWFCSPSMHALHPDSSKA
eukprot:CAMPEP_0177490564 /NCGR_PEP_ID=MMETSP0369-20130122/31332_1 /TAXON_ID=447022 ORGANISM="Scrippsiella hangoei-like, Strain SHHI-4" /NCGR_SAMPLE_ID=MMETSP0369 /ASSEMBLY_ACC=CAM_ASM_000364 /LENGTH=247 /DNA_ID=CAMNT_0018967159 /DNA_START=67 /DNA_END=810 /DNA_ORIENTATION=-